MKKYFKSLEIEVMEISAEDVLTGSPGGFLGGLEDLGGGGEDGGEELPGDEW